MSDGGKVCSRWCGGKRQGTTARAVVTSVTKQTQQKPRTQKFAVANRSSEHFAFFPRRTSPLPRWHTAARIRSGLSFGPKLFAKPGPTRPPFCGWPTRILARRRGFSRICRRNIELRKSAKKKKKQFYFSVVFLFVGPTVTPSISPHPETKNENAMSSATSSSGSSAR